MAEVITIKITGDATADGITNSVASVDIPQDGDLVGVYGELTVETNMGTSADFCRAELSFLSTNQFGANDARGSILELNTVHSAITSGSSHNDARQYMWLGQDGLRIVAGERLHIHSENDTGLDSKITFILYLRVRSAPTRRSTRRR